MPLCRACNAPAGDTKGTAGRTPKWGVILGLVSFAGIVFTTSKAAHAADIWVMSGIGGSSVDTFHVYSGVAYSPLGHLHEEGPIVKVFAKNFQFAYNTELAPGFSSEISAKGYGAEGLLGYQYEGGNWRAAAYAGVAWRNYTFSPHDPNNALLNKNWGGNRRGRRRVPLH